MVGARIFLFATLNLCWISIGRPTVRMAVEFNNHAASAYVAMAKGWFEEAGIESVAYESYVAGMALAAAMARGDIQVASRGLFRSPWRGRGFRISWAHLVFSNVTTIMSWETV
jgi:ABC-type nitrate/sulfonate/bicarbonate transport system substrate-binding protein